MMKKRIGSFFMAVVLALSCVCTVQPSMSVHAEENATLANIIQGKSILASSTANNCGPELAVDGASADGSQQWNSVDMKTWGQADANTKDNEAQTAQWLLVDRGEGAAEKEISSIKLWYNMKVWPMAYQIYTAEESSITAGATITADELANWTKLAEVSRPSAFALVTNGTGQNIADTDANTDTITATSVPALAQDAKAQRYVLLYIEKVNAQAPGNNVNIREFEIFAEGDPAPANVQTVLDGIATEDLTIQEGQIVIDTHEAYGVRAYVRGSNLENVVSNSGKVSAYNIGDRTVTLLVRVENEETPTIYAEKNMTVTISDHSGNYPEGYFPTVSEANKKPEVIPTLQEWYGYTGDFRLTDASKIIYKNTADIDLSKAAQNMKSDLQEIAGLNLAVVDASQAEPSSNDIYLEAQAEDTYGVGEEGYLLKVDDTGVKIYAPTYTGCLYGTITVEQILDQAEDHLTVPKGITRDYPAYEVRGLMLDVARTPYRLSQLQDYTKIMLWYKMNEYHLHINDCDNCNSNDANTDYSKYAGFHRLESKTFPSLTSEVKEAGFPSDLRNEEYYLNNNDYQGNPTYSKEEWVELQELCSALGIHMLTEIDLPGHSLLYNKYADENPDEIDWLAGGVKYTSNNLGNNGGMELLDLVGENKERALLFAQTLWNEYTKGPNSTIFGDVVHIGADEYWDHSNEDVKDAFANFADSLRQTIQENLGEGTKIRMWGAGTGMFSTAAQELADVDLPENYQLDIWSIGCENAKARAAEGYEIVNCRDAYTYGNPGRTFRDVPNAEMLFNEWNPTIFGANDVLLGEPNLLGAKTVIWGDQSQEGMTERDVHQRVLRAVSIMSEKTWGSTDPEDTFEEFEVRAARLAEGPGTTIAMEIESETSLVLDYDFANLSSDGLTVYDTSGNGYDGTFSSEAQVSEDGYVTFDGDKMVTPLKTLSYPYSVAFSLKVNGEQAEKNTKDSSIFSGYDGQLQIAGTSEGHLSGNVNYFTRDFNYTVPTDNTEAKIMLVGTFQGTKLYVNGQLVTFLSQKEDKDSLVTGEVTTLYSSFLLPLEKIGEGLHAQMKGLQVYNRALSAEEVAAYYTDAWASAQAEVNVAQNTYAGSTSRPNREAADTTDRRIHVAFKVVDGDAFVEKANRGDQPDTATSEIYSYWKGSRTDSALRIDLGEERRISKVEIQWRCGGKGKDFNIQVSSDGENWTTVKEIRGNGEFFNLITLDQPVEARYVRMQGIASNAGGGASYMIQEFMVYESVDKSGMDTLIQRAEEIMEDSNLDFETSNEIDQKLVDAVILASSVRNNKTATIEHVDTATAKLTAALELQNQNPSYEIESIETEEQENGTITFSKESARTGDLVAFSVTPKENYKICKVTVQTEDGTEVPVTIDLTTGIGSFTMPAGKVGVKVVYELITSEPAPTPDQPSTTPTPDQSTPTPSQPSKDAELVEVSKPSGKGNQTVAPTQSKDSVGTGDAANIGGYVIALCFAAALPGIVRSVDEKKKKTL